MSVDASNTRLSAQKLSVGYRSKKAEKAILEALDLEINAGEFICLLGSNGAGKSTLMRTLSGTQKPLAGTIQLGKRNFDTINPHDRAKVISTVLTDTFPKGLMDVYAFTALGRHPYSGWFGGLSSKDHQIISEALEAANAVDLADRQVSELSDGERQKAAIARALAQQADLMIAVPAHKMASTRM